MATRVELDLPRGFSFDAVVRSHGWYDLPPFSYDREAGGGKPRPYADPPRCARRVIAN